MIYNGSQGLRPDPNGNIEQTGRAGGRENTETDGTSPQKRIAGAQPASASLSGAPEKRIVTDGGTRSRQELNDRLSDFQQRILLILAEEARYGLAVRRALEERVYGDEVHHGRLYTNLGKLVDLGLVEKSDLDKRTKEYAITEDGLHWCREDAQWRLGMLDRGDADPEHDAARDAASKYATGGDE